MCGLFEEVKLPLESVLGKKKKKKKGVSPLSVCSQIQDKSAKKRIWEGEETGLSLCVADLAKLTVRVHRV